MVSGNLSPELQSDAKRAEALARDAGLDFFEVVFEMLDAADVNAVASYGGFPVRYPSWRFGMEYERLHKGYQYGLSKIYELVINNDPTYAYLVRSNSRMEQKLVMAHVFGHADFFKHNAWFAPTERQMVDVMARNAERVRGHIERYGQEEVERFLDLALSLENLIDPYLPTRERLSEAQASGGLGLADRARHAFEQRWGGGAVDTNHDATLSAGRLQPTYDLLGFLMDNAPLEEWQRDILHIVREEAYYFVPQRMTKVINEGWASFWHSKILTGGFLEPSEIIDFADCHAGATAVSPGQLNPYKLGIELFRYAEEKGRDLLHLRSIHNDVSFIDELVDEEFASRNQLFVSRVSPRTGRSEVADRSWTAVKEQLLRELSWCGAPRIELTGVDGGGSLQLVHQHEGRDIKFDEAGVILGQLAQIWRQPVHLLTLDQGQGRRLVHDGAELTTLDTSATPQRRSEAG